MLRREEEDEAAAEEELQLDDVGCKWELNDIFWVVFSFTFSSNLLGKTIND